VRALAAQVDTFELAGPAWINLSCILGYLLLILPAGVFLIHAGVVKRRLWLRARRCGYDDRRLARDVARIGLQDKFKDQASLARFRKRRLVGVGDVLGGGVMVGFSIMVFIWVPLGAPVRLQVTPSEFILDYRWPRLDRRVPVSSVRHVEYYKSYWRGRRGATDSNINLRVSLDSGELVRIEPGYAGKYDNLRAAGAALAERANLRLQETVLDKR
jgi:hypothetical protein